MYEQSLVKTIQDHIKPKVLKRNNRYKKWEYGYDVEHDVVIIKFSLNMTKITCHLK